jgi:ArsR family transcriptional regulator
MFPRGSDFMARATISPEAVFQAISDSTRLRLLRLLQRQELNVQELVRILGMNQPRISKHLAVLREAGWLRQRKEGTWSWYRATTQADFSTLLPSGATLFKSVLAAADQVQSAREDDATLAVILSERDARAHDFFAGIAGQWDQIRRTYEHPDIQLGAVSALVDDSLSVVDIGTGTGALLPLLAGAAGRVVAVDNSNAMLARARVLCERSHLNGVVFQKADIQALPFGDASFQAAFCSMVLHHVARPAVAIGEMARVVIEGGKVVVIAFTRHNLTWMREELAHQWLGFDREEMEQLYREAGLRLDRYFTRGRTEKEREGNQEPGQRKPQTKRSSRRGSDEWAWPEVFIAVGTKPRLD